MTDTINPERQATERKFLFLLGSSRTGGNTEKLARKAAAQLPAEVEQQWLRLRDMPLPDFDDLRHTGDRTRPLPTGDEKLLLDATLEATDLVIASPLYWYTVSADTKVYLDYWAGWLHLREQVRFKERMAGKKLWGITVISDEDPANADPLLGTLRLTADYMGMEWAGGLVGHGNRPDDIDADTATLTAAKTFFGA
ncbi:NAD(P)H-dependent oxidoreductase [Streptomyces triculaminicus]|uniref:flavodoxin family protein n=1 Tax=Streptomyces triculaminicus TaxID=2816232 RepID=UPI0033DEDE63